MDEVARLLFIDHNGEERTVELEDGAFRIGRLPDNDLFIENPYISREHAEIISDAEKHAIFDLDSTSGTFVNFERIKKRTLRDGDRIRLGRGHGFECLFRAGNLHGDTHRLMEDTRPSFHPVRVIEPDDGKFIDTSKLPQAARLPGKTVEWLRSLYEFTSEMLGTHSSADLADSLAGFLKKTLEADRCAILLYDFERDLLQPAVTLPRRAGSFASTRIARHVYEENLAVLTLDASSDERFAGGDSVRLNSIRSAMCAPIGSKTRRWGVCYVDNTSADRLFDEEDLEYIAAIARQAGLAIENIYLLEEQRRSLESFIKTLAATLDARDDATAGHSARVGAYAQGIAKSMGLGNTDSRLIYYAGLLHDYGKIGIRDDVLLKPAELTPDEYEHIKQHPLHTYRLLSNIRLPEEMAEIPRVAAAHHERWDGSGYPHGLAKEDIPLGSRIVAVADAFDALVEERVYSEAVPPDEAFDEITSRAGTYFDPAVVEGFSDYYKGELAARREVRRAQKGQKEMVEAS